MSDKDDFGWAIPTMQAGYAGRGLVYAAIAGFSLYAIWQGGQAQGTGSALKQLESTTWGSTILVLIAVGLLCYFVWRVVCGIYDLEDYGTDAKGMFSRAGQITTGVIHGVMGIAAFAILFSAAGGSSGGGAAESGGSGGGGGSTIAEWTGKIMSLPAGIWIVGIAGLLTVGAGVYYLVKAYTEKYRENLEANEFTRNWNWMLKAGVAAQGVVVTIVGVFLCIAAWQADPSQAGGLDKAFSWLSGQWYGQVLVTLLCIGLLSFAIFCFVNAAHRIVPKASGDDVQTMAQRAKRKAA